MCGYVDNIIGEFRRATKPLLFRDQARRALVFESVTSPPEHGNRDTESLLKCSDLGELAMSSCHGGQSPADLVTAGKRVRDHLVDHDNATTIRRQNQACHRAGLDAFFGSQRQHMLRDRFQLCTLLSGKVGLSFLISQLNLKNTTQTLQNPL